MGNQISITPCDKKFRRGVTKKIKEIFAESNTMEDAEKRLIYVVTEMLKAKQSVWIRVEKENDKEANTRTT